MYAWFFDCSVSKFTEQWLCLKKVTFHLAMNSNNCPGRVLETSQNNNGNCFILMIREW